jgi:hypothetical protein
MSKMANGDFETENADKKESLLDEKVVDAYKKLGVVLKHSKSSQW